MNPLVLKAGQTSGFCLGQDCSSDGLFPKGSDDHLIEAFHLQTINKQLVIVRLSLG